MNQRDKDKPLILAKGDDWEGIYVKGVLYSDGHSLDAETIVEATFLAGISSMEDFVQSDVDLDWLDSEGRLPKDVADVVWHNGE